MGQSIEQLVTSTRYVADLHDIAQLSAEERAELLARYKAEVADLAALQEQAFEAFKQTAPHIPDRATCLAFSRVARKHQAAQRALARIEQAVAQALPRRIDGLTFSL